MYSYLQKRLFRPEISKRISKTRLLCLVKRVEKSFQSKQRSLLIEGTPATSSTFRTSAARTVFVTQSTQTGLRRLWKSFMRSTMRRSKTYHSISQSRLSRLRVPSKMARHACRHYAPKASRRAPAIMDYSTLASILRRSTQRAGKTRWLNTTTSMWLPLCPTTKSNCWSSRLARRSTTTSARMRRSTRFATPAFAALANSVSEPLPLMHLR